MTAFPLDPDLHRLLQTRLLTAAVAEEFGELLQATTSLEMLLKELVHCGGLTPFQAEQVAAGKAYRLLFGPYVLLNLLAQGSMAQTFLARHARHGGVVALKTLRRDKAHETDTRQRFHREVRIASRLAHPHIVRALDAGTIRDRDYVTMDFVPGTDLQQLVRQQGPPPMTHACEYIRQAALGVHHAHERGLIHRDLKPANLLLTPERLVKVVDFGLARRVRAEDPSLALNHTETLLGNTDYLAPEQAVNTKAIDHRCDIFSLGGTFYFLLTGCSPFPNARRAAGKPAVQPSHEPPPIERIRPQVGRDLGDLVRRMMAQDPEQRPPTMAAVAEALTVHHDPTPETADNRWGELVIFDAPPDAVPVLEPTGWLNWLWPRRDP